MKRLNLGRDKVIAGVCSGIADYLLIDPAVIRVGFVLFTLAGGSGIIAYIVAMIVMPEPRDSIDDL